jgi:predicted enzyme related to lactoylglutathione lyase
MRIGLNSVIVQDQESALRFYTGVLGFEKKIDLPAGDYRWLTVVAPEEPDGTQLVLEPDAHPASATYQRALYESGIPLTAFAVDDIENEYRRLKELGVVFRTEPTEMGGAIVSVFDDTCGNLIQIYQEP